MNASSPICVAKQSQKCPMDNLLSRLDAKILEFKEFMLAQSPEGFNWPRGESKIMKYLCDFSKVGDFSLSL